MVDQDIEKLLIRSVHSHKEACQFFADNLSDESVFDRIICIVMESESGDARMEGAYWISRCNEALLKKSEDILLRLMDDEWDPVAVHIMVALSRIKSERALTKILDNRVKPVLHWEAVALKNYFT